MLVLRTIAVSLTWNTDLAVAAEVLVRRAHGEAVSGRGLAAIGGAARSTTTVRRVRVRRRRQASHRGA
jgi:predicted transcriptional regulator